MTNGGVYVFGHVPEYVDDRTPMRVRIGKADDFDDRLGSHRSSALRSISLLRAFTAAEPTLFEPYEQLLHDRLAPFRVIEEGLGRSCYDVPLAELDKAACIRGLQVVQRWKHPRNANHTWKRFAYTKLGAYFIWLEMGVAGRITPRDHECVEMLGELASFFPHEMKPVLEKLDGGVSAMRNRISHMFLKGYETEHPDLWPNREIHEGILVASGWKRYPLNVLI